MRAARIDAPGQLRVLDVAPPAPGAGEVVATVAYAGVCGSDVEVLAGRRPAGFVRYPIVPGHEWAGTVTAVGDGVDPALAGRKVVAEGFRSCHTCGRCRAGQSVLCEAAYDETGFTRPGGWAERLAVPAELVHVLSDDADLRSASGLEPAACAADAVGRAAARPGDRVAVVGGGTIGLLAVQLLREADPAELTVVEPNPHRAERARRCGATRIVDPGDTDAWTDHFDVVVEAAGAAGAARASVAIARRGGRIVLAGIPDEAATLTVRDVVTKRLEIATVFGAPRPAWQAAVAAFERGILDPGVLVTHELPLAEVGAALALLTDGDPTVGKILLRP